MIKKQCIIWIPGRKLEDYIEEMVDKMNEVIDVVNGHEVFFESMRGVDKSEVKKHGED